jgi:TfoX/Sxy family transcriptional regulator of competence genes
MAMKWKPAPPEAVTAFAAATKNIGALEHRKMFGYDAVFANDRMVGGLHEVGMVLRLSDRDRDRFVAEHDTKPFVVMGRTMREYVVVPGSLYDDPATLEKWVERGLAYVSSMPPKSKAGSKALRTKAPAPKKPGPKVKAPPAKAKRATPKKAKRAAPKKTKRSGSKKTSAARKR